MIITGQQNSSIPSNTPPLLPLSSHTLPPVPPQQLRLRQGEAATLENKNPKGGTSLAALEDCWAPTPHQGPPGATARGWETLGPGPATSSGARLLPCASPMVDGRSLGREGGTQPGQLGCRTKAAPGASCPHPLAWQPDREVGRMLRLAEPPPSATAAPQKRGSCS